MKANKVISDFIKKIRISIGTLLFLQSQFFCSGAIAYELNGTINFERETKTITNNNFTGRLLRGHLAVRSWEEFL